MNKSINEVLKEKERLNAAKSPELTLDDARWVKVLSPGRLVFKRFVRNRLAIAGAVILTVMFLFAFLGPLFYPYTQTQIFYKFDSLTVDYASAAVRTEYSSYMTDASADVDFTVKNSMNSIISSMESDGKQEILYTGGDGSDYAVRRLADMVYGVYTGETLAMVSTTYVFDGFPGAKITDGFRVAALTALTGNGSFTVDGEDYSIQTDGDETLVTAGGQPYAELSPLAVRSYSGADDLDIGFKEAVRESHDKMTTENLTVNTFTCDVPKLSDAGERIPGEYESAEMTMTKKVGQYVLTCKRTTYLIDIFSGPTADHPFGTDGDGMDVLARMMYGGRVSLLVGFVVVILEVLLGVIFGGIAGFFGGWTDSLIMRLVDIFYCIPTLPIMIILGAMLDSLKMNAYLRLVWMMAVLGLLGWAGVARLVRGQILSLREQEFMTAAEATGIKAGHRIFRHLIPNVLPQLIVYATMNLGSVIIYESTLSYLGLGVKHPLATWGTMINSVAGSAEAMIRYTYIWVPVGFLICLTVIAFNFVGDGLRDAFDPKMKH